MSYFWKKVFFEKSIHNITNSSNPLYFRCSFKKKKTWGDTLIVDFSKAFDSIHREKMEQKLIDHGLPKEYATAIMMLYKNTKVKVRSPGGDTDFHDIVAGVLYGDILAHTCY